MMAEETSTLLLLFACAPELTFISREKLLTIGNFKRHDGRKANGATDHPTLTESLKSVLQRLS